jgi:hypothetical protein
LRDGLDTPESPTSPLFVYLWIKNWKVLGLICITFSQKEGDGISILSYGQPYDEYLHLWIEENGP